MSEEKNNLLDLGSFDFAPSWAKQTAGVAVSKVSAEKFSADGGNDARPMRDRREGGKGGLKKPFGNKPRNGDDRRDRPRFERPKPLDVEIKILPETKALGTIIRKLQNDFHAYKLKDLAYFFLDNPQSVLLKVSPKAQPNGEKLDKFHQCKACGFASTQLDDVLEHAISAHLVDYYDSKEIEVEPPKGNFNCVAKCGLSGVLLGPPNIHEFNLTIKEMIRTRYPNMSESDYRARIEMVRDADAIEEWRKGATKRIVFMAKGAGEDAAPMTREQVEGEFRRTILASLIDSPKNLMITADVAMKSPIKPLVWAVKDALAAERRNPHEMCFALRGAFHHRKMKFFRTNDARGQEFVTNMQLKEFDAAHAIPELAKIARFIEDNPCCDKSELGNDAETEKYLNWLVTTGHVVAFTNGVYSKVEKYPKYGPQWKKRAKPQATEEAVAPVEAANPAEEATGAIVQEPKVEEEEVKKDEAANQLA